MDTAGCGYAAAGCGYAAAGCANLMKNLTEEFHEGEQGDLSLVNTMKFVPAFLCYYLF
jgi:hypothetical protein